MLYTALVIVVTADPVSESVPECALRFEDNGACACSTHDPEGPVKCHNDSRYIEIQPCHCIYYDQHLNKTVMGRCYPTCYEHSNILVEVTSSTEFNEDICNFDPSSHRSGFFCYRCNESYGMAPYSYLMIDCVHCEHYGFQNWLKFFAIALLPLTLFYILAVLLSWNITSSSFAGIILVIQCITSSPLRSEVYLLDGEVGQTFVKIVFSLLEMFNLSFFRKLIPPFCLNPKFNVFGVVSVDYMIALYPFLLIFITYALITIYDKHYRLLIWVWKPFKKCFHGFRSTSNIRTSLIEVFASFILLSSVKILRASFDFLSCIPTYDVAGRKLDNDIATLSDNVKCFGSHHLPFALLAIAISSIFVIVPLFLLVFYPCRCFQKCLNCCRLRLLTLHVFMDAFQGSYRLQPRDMRSFSALYLFLRLLMLAHVELFLSLQTLYVSGIISLVSAALIALFQPYKVKVHNTVDSILLLLMGIYFISDNEMNLLSSLHESKRWTFASVIQALSLLLIIVYFCSLVIWKMLHKKFLLVLNMLKAKGKSTENSNTNRGVMESFDDMIEDRRCNSYSGESQHLLAEPKKHNST